jgi:hypothetical protein
MKRNEGCKGCSWNFGRTPWPCVYCEDHDLFIDFPYHSSENKHIQKMVIGMISATIYYLIYLTLPEGLELEKDASLQ